MLSVRLHIFSQQAPSQAPAASAPANVNPSPLRKKRRSLLSQPLPPTSPRTRGNLTNAKSASSQQSSSPTMADRVRAQPQQLAIPPQQSFVSSDPAKLLAIADDTVESKEMDFSDNFEQAAPGSMFCL